MSPIVSILRGAVRRAADAAMQSMIEDGVQAAKEAARRLRVQTPDQQPPPKRVHYTARIVK